MKLTVSTVLGVSFHDYVRRVARDRFGEESDEKIARRLDTTGKTVGSWQTSAPAARYVIKFAHAYGIPMPEAFMQAYGLTAEELGVQVSPDPAVLSNEQLIEELRRRLADPEAPWSDRNTRRHEESRRQARSN